MIESFRPPVTREQMTAGIKTIEDPYAEGGLGGTLIEAGDVPVAETSSSELPKWIQEDLAPSPEWKPTVVVTDKTPDRDVPFVGEITPEMARKARLTRQHRFLPGFPPLSDEKKK